MDAARPREREGYVEDVACAIAAVLRRRPVVSATVLIAGIAGIAVTMGNWYGLDPALFRACVSSAAFLAGAALGGTRLSARRIWTRGTWAAVATAVVLVVDAVLFRSTMEDDGVAPSIKLVSFLGLVFFLGFGLRNRVAIVCAAGFGAMTVVPSVVAAVGGQQWATYPVEPALFAGWLAVLVMLLVARRGRWGLVLPFAVVLVLWHEAIAWEYWRVRDISTKDSVGFAEIFVLAGVSLLLPVIAGRVAAALRRDDDRDAGARLVVRLQRDPWRTAVVAVLVATAFLESVEWPSTASLLVVVAGMACVAHCVAGPSLAALAPWTAAAAISVPLSLAFQARLKDRFFELTVLPEALIIAYVPLVIGAVVGGTRTLRWPWWGWVALAVAWMMMVFNVGGSVWTADWTLGADLVRDAAWCVVVSLLVHAVATSAVPARVVLAASAAVSFSAIDGFYGIHALVPGWFRDSPIVPALLAGPAAAMLALAARRVRSMTALPEDHPSFELPAARARGLVPAPNP
jgi:hypothetical protein